MVVSKPKQQKPVHKRENMFRVLLGDYWNLICLELLKGLKRKYASKNPLYLVLGDFNLRLKPRQLPPEWRIYPQNRETARKLRHRVPIDYVLMSGLFEVEQTVSKEFSPLPLEIKRDNGKITAYRFSDAASLLSEDCKPISLEDLEHSPAKSNSTLLGNTICESKITGEDEFENKQKFLTRDTKRTFDHDFIFFRTRIQHTVFLPISNFLIPL